MEGRVFVHLLVVWGAAGWQTPPPRPHRDVRTTQGAVRGYLVGGHPRYFAYFGVPYARPPTRRDRYKAPKPLASWDGLFEATHRIRCPQLNAAGEENCLVVNVFVAEEASSHPVLVIVHGGAFHSGWGTHRPPARLLEKGFVIASFNYRIGAMGFLCLDIPDATGNAGLKDQIAALYWINRNIARFGGNPRDITVYGTGAGATSIQMLLLSGLGEGLFHKVIIESGSVLAPTFLNYDPLSIAIEAANRLGYNGTDDVTKLYQFYLNASTNELITISDMFSPCVENDSYYSYSLLDSDPVHVLKQGHFHKLPMLTIFTDDKGIAMIGVDETANFEEMPDQIEYLLPNNLKFERAELKKKVGAIVKEFYFGDDCIGCNILENYSDYIQDIFNEYPVVKFAMLYASKSSYSVYLMKIYVEDLGIEMDQSLALERGIVLDFFYKNNDDEPLEASINKKLVTLWMNFIKMSDPTPLSTTLIPVVWQAVQSMLDDKPDISRVPVLHFPSLQIKPPPYNTRLLFWDNIYNRFYRSHHIQKTDDY